MANKLTLAIGRRKLKCAALLLTLVTLSGCEDSAKGPSGSDPTLVQPTAGRGATTSDVKALDGGGAGGSVGETDAGGVAGSASGAAPDSGSGAGALTAEAVQAAIDEAARCTADDQCVSAGSMCPFGCSIDVHRDHEARIKKLLADYAAKTAEGGCVYRCAQLQPPRCVEGRCRSDR